MFGRWSVNLDYGSDFITVVYEEDEIVDLLYKRISSPRSKNIVII